MRGAVPEGSSSTDDKNLPLPVTMSILPANDFSISVVDFDTLLVSEEEESI